MTLKFDAALIGQNHQQALKFLQDTSPKFAASCDNSRRGNFDGMRCRRGLQVKSSETALRTATCRGVFGWLLANILVHESMNVKVQVDVIWGILMRILVSDDHQQHEHFSRHLSCIHSLKPSLKQLGSLHRKTWVVSLCDCNSGSATVVDACGKWF